MKLKNEIKIIINYIIKSKMSRYLSYRCSDSPVFNDNILLYKLTGWKDCHIPSECFTKRALYQLISKVSIEFATYLSGQKEGIENHNGFYFMDEYITKLTIRSILILIEYLEESDCEYIHIIHYT